MLPDDASEAVPDEEVNDEVDVISLEMWDQVLLTNMSVIDPLPSHLQQAFAEVKGQCINQLLGW